MVRRVTHNFERAPDSLHAARTFVRVILDAWGVRGLTDSATLVTSELATQAMFLGSGGYQVTVEYDQPELRIEVAEGPSSLPPRLGPA